MAHHRDDGADGRRRGRHPHGRRHERERRGSRRKRRRELTAEQKLYRKARRRAAVKLSVVSHAFTYGAVVLMLVFVAGPRAAFYTAFGWGIFVVLHYFFAMVAPGLRRRFIEHEVSREVDQSAGRERRSLEDAHARSLEQLSASIAHEIRNPVTAAKSLVQQMGEDPTATSGERRVRRTWRSSELDRVERSISHLLRYARDEELRVSRRSTIADLLDSALETFRDRIERLGVRDPSANVDGGGLRCEGDGGEAAPRGDQPDRQRARRRRPRASRVDPDARGCRRARTSRAPKPGSACSDNGPGIDAQRR